MIKTQKKAKSGRENVIQQIQFRGEIHNSKNHAWDIDECYVMRILLYSQSGLKTHDISCCLKADKRT